jgi:AcrR family transcriptional regulator
MPDTKRTRGVTKDEWLRAALDDLSFGSITDISVQALARKLGIGKSGFYWHFRNKAELLRALLDYWVHEITEVITANPQMQELDPEARLRKTAEMILDFGLVHYEIGIRQWALRDAEAAKVVKKVKGDLGRARLQGRRSRDARDGLRLLPHLGVADVPRDVEEETARADSEAGRSSGFCTPVERALLRLKMLFAT